MSRRRWVLLATTLVALNLALWLVPQGLALGGSLIDQLFGPRMVRAEVVMVGADGTPQDYRVDRGVIVGSTRTAITLAEADGTTQTIPVARGTRVLGFALGPRHLPKNIRVLVVHEANGPAMTIQVETR
jgi:hypothetical protein